ncbi:unnamed protein product [Cercopithifilaria johnstoni]|uniref:Uncharacterized protein n=1 Tax=Cercopithifilaria johnstoni TaxID=2874296 RepID=A0A8J2M4Y3_9BILA|nr:unnamed protein product [Cercopithifilaria johnstoni]
MLKKQASNSDLMGNSTKYSDNYRGAITERDDVELKKAKMEEVRQIINALKMNNRVDDLNRDWQERLKNENVKWENDIHSSNKSCNKLTESKSSYKIDKGLRQMERHLFKLTNRLSSIPKMEQKLDEIIGILQRNYCYRSIPATNKSHISKSESIGNTTKTAKNMQNNSPIAKISDYYGVVEITENYYLV